MLPLTMRTRAAVMMDRLSLLGPIVKILGLIMLIFACLFCALATGVAQTDDECLACHSDRSLSMERGGTSVSLFVDGKPFGSSAHGGLGCVACHEGFSAAELPHKPKITPVRCLSCHEDSSLLTINRSVHARGAQVKRPSESCAGCHPPHAVRKLSNLTLALRKRETDRICGACHSSAFEVYRMSVHGAAHSSGIAESAGCVDCHGEHGVLPASDSAAATGRERQVQLCLHCHLDNPDVRARVSTSAGFIASYEQSVHGQAHHNGNSLAAVCSDCHGAHDVRKGSDSKSMVAKGNIAATCATCHPDVREQYDQSIHGAALARGVTASPTCTDCHGEHDILSPRDARSPVAATNVSREVCSPCHASVRLTRRYGLQGDRFRTFMDSYHGLASSAGSVEVANCASCHGVHDIKPSTDSTSSVHPRNLATTCGNCHPGANENFTKGSVHVLATSKDDEVLYFVSSMYLVLITVTIGGMLAHNILDFIKKSRLKLMVRRGEIAHRPVAHRLYLRMTLNERIQHGILLTSFLTLVVTGFALRFPDAWWVAPWRSISPWVFELRGILHRVAAVLLVAVSLFHIYYVLVIPRGKELIRDLLPRQKDLPDMIGVLKFNLGLAREKPKLGRFSYIEKAEYWALIWGTIVMTVTGIILWADNYFLGLITKLWWDVARTVHYYEAWLAMLSILIWHFYFVMFNPDTYPINLAFWKGTLTEAEMEEEHPAELEQIRERAAADAAAREQAPE
jgi:cytochrome b subunit of formate dehydrogenase/nitrate/TMAO reductase-like tetraheme cytochrome c subunit